MDALTIIIIIILSIYRIYLEDVEDSFWMQVILVAIIFIVLIIYTGGKLWQSFIR